RTRELTGSRGRTARCHGVAGRAAVGARVECLPCLPKLIHGGLPVATGQVRPGAAEVRQVPGTTRGERGHLSRVRNPKRRPPEYDQPDEPTPAESPCHGVPGRATAVPGIHATRSRSCFAVIAPLPASRAPSCLRREQRAPLEP